MDSNEGNSGASQGSLWRLLWTSIRLGVGAGERAREAFARSPKAERPQSDDDDINVVVATVAISFVGAIVLTFILFVASIWDLTVFPWVGAAVSDHGCAKSSLCAPIAIRAVPIAALSDAEWARALKSGNAIPGQMATRLEHARHKSARHFLISESEALAAATALDVEERSDAARAAEKSDAALASAFIRQLAKGLTPSEAARASLATAEPVARTPSAKAKARLAILASHAIVISPTDSRRWVTPAAMWSPPPESQLEAWAARQAIDGFAAGSGSFWLAVGIFLLLCVLVLSCIALEKTVALLNLHRPGLEQAAEALAIERAAGRTTARSPTRRL